MREIFLENFGTFLGAILTGLAGFLFGRRKLKAETETIEAENTGKEIDNADKLVKLYKDAIDDLGTRYEVKFKEVTALYENKVKLLNDEIGLLKRNITQLKSEVSTLRKKLKENKIS